MDRPANQPTVVIKHAGLRSVGAFAAFPTNIIRNGALSIGARLTYGLLLSYAWQQDFCFPAQEQLAKDLSVTDRHVRRFLIELRDKKLISWKQMGLNRPNIYYILDIDPANTESEPENEEISNEDLDRTSMSGPERTSTSASDRTLASAQERTPASDYKDSRTNKHNVVNDVTPNDSDSTRRDRRPTGTPTISDRALRSKYGFSDEQIGQVHWLVDQQLAILGRFNEKGRDNHPSYVKRAAEAVQAGDHQFLAHKLGDFKEAAPKTKTPVGSRPAYFHVMWVEALQQRDGADSAPSARVSSGNPQRIGGLFQTNTVDRDDNENDRIAKLVADAERRGHPVPAHIRTSNNLAQVSRWWATLADTVRRT